MTTRAIHLEVVPNNTAEEFLLVFRKFIACRGKPEVVYCDNATTFHGAKDANQILVYKPNAPTIVSDYCVNRKITWKYITPLFPWKGGFYERMVSLFKSACRKTVGRSALEFTHLQTITTEIEATLNARPITPYWEGDVGAHVLRPIDFLIPRSDVQLPLQPSLPEDLYDSQNNLAKFYKVTLQLLDHFWDIRHSQYLSMLGERQQERMRSKRTSIAEPQIGDVVIVADDHLPRGSWPYGLVAKLLTSKDNRT